MFLIGMGASAGGLQALTEFFRHKQTIHGASFIVILHSLRTYQSKLVSILGKVTTIECVAVKDGMALEQGKIFVCPPSHIVSISLGLFKLTERDEEDKINQTVNHFFTSLAAHAKANAIGVIMSGTGTDGTSGSQEIEKYGGVVIVQDPKTAQFDGMPLTSIRYDHPDYVLAPDEMPLVIDSIIDGNEDINARRQRALVYS